MDQLLATAKTTAFLPLLTERFARERLQALGKVEGSCHSPSLPSSSLRPQRGRSQMAAGWMRQLAATVSSSTREVPSLPREINVAVVEAMEEVGIDIRAEFPKPWTDEVVRASMW